MPPQVEDKSEVLTNDFIKNQESHKTIKFEESKTPSFVNDVLPYFQPLICMLLYFWSVQYLENVMIGMWIMYILTPVYNMLFNNDETNLRQHAEKGFIDHSMFLVPLYLYIVVELGFHFYCLCLFSDKWRPDVAYPIFDYVPN